MLYIYLMKEYMNDDEIRKQIIARKRKQRTRRRILIICIALILAVVDGVFVGRTLGNKKYDDEIAAFVDVTPDIPIVNIAVEQIGNKSGKKFWSWYGFDYYVAWCGCFVSYCEDKAGYLSNGNGVKFAYVPEGVNWFKAHNRWLDGGKTPAPGDVIFFDWEQSGGVDHTGLVTAVVDNKVFTIEGNSSDRCRQKRYLIDDPVIFGYGRLGA